MAAKEELARLNVWRNRVGWSRKVRQDYLPYYDKYIQYYKGDQLDIMQVALDELVIVNLFYSHIKATLPILYFQNPYFYVREKRPEFRSGAELSESVLNYYTRRNKVKKEFRLATLDAIFLFGVLKMGYDPIFRKNDRKGKYVKYGFDENGKEILLIDPDTGELMVEPDELLIKENFFMKRVSPRNMLFDPEPKNFIEDQTWIGEDIIERLDDVKDNELYKNRDKVKETHLANKETFYMAGNQSYQDEIQNDLKRVRLIKLYDFRDEVYRVYADGQQDESIGFLFEDDIDKSIKMHPYSILKFNEIPDEFVPLSDLEVLEGPQDNYNLGISILSSHVKKFIRKYLFETGAFKDDDEREKMLEAIECMVEMNKGGAEKVVPAPVPTVEPDLYQYIDRNLQAFWMTAGRTEQERGTVERRKTMFESSQIEKYGQLRNQDKVSLVEDWAVESAEKLLDSLQGNLRLPIAVEIAGELGKYWETDLTRERIQGEMDVSIALGSTTPKIPEFEKQQLAEFLKIVSELPGIEMMIKQPIDKEIDIGEFILQLAKKYDIEEYEIVKKKQQQPGGMTGGMIGENVINMPQILQQLGLKGGGGKGRASQKRQIPGRQLKRAGRNANL